MDMVKYKSGFGTASVYEVFTQYVHFFPHNNIVKVATSAVGINKFSWAGQRVQWSQYGKY